MGKIDEMRRQREQQFAWVEAQRKTTSGGVGVVSKSALEALPSDPDEDSVERVVRMTTTSSRSSRALAEVKGECSACGKLRAVNNGLIANHQKGLGKMCVGSRQKPA